MDTRRALLRSAAVLALAVSIIGSTALTPSVSAAPVSSTADLATVASKKTDKQKHDDNDNNSSEGEGGGLSDLPIIGDVVGDLKDAPPEQIVDTAVQFVGSAADTAIPLIRSLFK